LKQRAFSRIANSYEYFQKLFFDPYQPLSKLTCYDTLELFKIARICDPYYIVTGFQALTSDHLDSILSPLVVPYARLGEVIRPPLLSRSSIDKMKLELPRLLHHARTTLFEGDDLSLVPDFETRLVRIVSFWKSNRINFPTWFEFTCLMYLYQPSSGAAERVFSILTKLFHNDAMKDALMDYIEGSLLASVNKDYVI
jgi:hypothetical protein